MDVTRKKKGIHPDLIIMAEKYSFKMATSKTDRITRRN